MGSPDGQLPWLINFGNRGNEQAESEGEEVIISASEMRRVAECWESSLAPICDSWGLSRLTNHRGCAVSFNVPYKGSFEVQSLFELSKKMGVTPHVFQVE